MVNRIKIWSFLGPLYLIQLLIRLINTPLGASVELNIDEIRFRLWRYFKAEL